MGVRSRRTKRRGGGLLGNFFKSNDSKKAALRELNERNMVTMAEKNKDKDEKMAKKEWGEHYRILYWISKALQVIKEDDNQSGVSFKLANARLEAVKKLWATSPSKKRGSALNLMRLQNVYANAVNPRLNEGKPIGKLSNVIDGIINLKGPTEGPKIKATAIQAINDYMFYLMIDDIEKTLKGTGVDNFKYRLFISHPNMDFEGTKMHSSCKRPSISACENKLDELLIAVERPGLAIILDKGKFSVVGSTQEDIVGSAKLADIKANNILQHTEYKDRISNFEEGLSSSRVPEGLINEIGTYFKTRRDMVINTVINEETAYLRKARQKYQSYMSSIAKDMKKELGREDLAYDMSWLTVVGDYDMSDKAAAQPDGAAEAAGADVEAQPNKKPLDMSGGRNRRTRRTRRRGGGVRKRTVRRRRVRRSRR